MSRIIGIDLGTTNSLVATIESGIPMVIADSNGRRLTPSVVYYPAGKESPVVGEAANRTRVVHPRSTFFSVKRFIGRRGVDVGPEQAGVPYEIVAGEAGPVQFKLPERTVLPEEVSAEVLRKLKQDAESFVGEPVTRAVITVPAYFNDAQRNATKRAGELAGFTVERIINEPTAAALAYGLHRLTEKSKIAVYDLGGGTFDLSILELHEGVFRVLSTNGNTQLGGDDLDARIVDFLKQQIESAGGPAASVLSEDLSVQARLRETAEQAKIRLSEATTTKISLPFLTGSFSYEYELSREQLERLTRGIIERTRLHCLRSLADANLGASELNQVILVGGQTRMPLVRGLVAEWFGCSEFEETRGDLRLGSDHHKADGPMLNTGVNPDEAVALGAAIQGAILSGEFKDMLLLDVTPLSLGLETFGGLMNVVIPRNSTIPVKAGEMFTTAVDHQREMLIHILQGERERARDNWSLGKFTLSFEAAPRGVPRVGVQFEIDANGILHVLARDIRTGQEKVVELKSAVDVDDNQVQQMVEESVDHAFEDLAARRWVEARLKAEELIKASAKGIADCAEELEPNYVDELQAAVKQLEGIVRAVDPETDVGDVKTLQAAINRVDVVSKPLAELLMDKAMESMLRKRGVIS